MEQQEADLQCHLASEDFAALQTEFGRAKDVWESERAALEDLLQQAHEDCGAAKGQLSEATNEHKGLETERDEANTRAQALAEEMEAVRLQITESVEQLHRMESGGESSQAEFQEQEAQLRSELEAANEANQQMQAEVTKNRERRQTVARTVQRQARTSMAVHEDRTRRLSMTQEGEHGVWIQKLDQSEQRAAKLEEELHRLRQCRRDKPAQVVTFEVENSRLFEEVQEAERRADELETEERARKRELVAVRSTHQELKTRREALEAQLEKLPRG